jgi:hypothetical protein
MIKIPAQLTRYAPRADGSMSVHFTTSFEFQEDDLIEVNRHRGLEGWLIFAENEAQEVEIPPVDADLESKSKSQRLRNVLYVQLEQKLGRKPKDSEWSEYYQKSMEAIIIKIKNTLE